MDTLILQFQNQIVILLMEEILHQFIGSLPCCYLQGFIHPRWLFGISSINRILRYFAIRPHDSQTLHRPCWKQKPRPARSWSPRGFQKKVPPVVKVTYLTGPRGTKFDV